MRQIIRTLILLQVVGGLMLSGCAGTAEPTNVPAEQQTDACGNGVCDEGESSQTCLTDCPEVIEPQPEAFEPLGYVTFLVKASDFVNLEDSTQTLLDLIDLFETNGVRGEFVLTGPITRLYAQEHLELMAGLSESNMTISYHVQPPHPLVPGFQAPLQGLPVNQTEETVLAYESSELDLSTGELLMNPGGYRYLEEMFGTPPAAVSIPDTSMRGFALPILQQLGAEVVVLKEGGTTSIDQPFHQEYGMWVRPVDIQLSHWTTDGIDASMAWWDMLGTELASAYQPAVRLESQVDAWNADRLPFILVQIDEYNFYRQGPPPWTLIYYNDPSMTQAASPPFDLGRPDMSSPRTPEDRAAIWEAFRQMVAWAAHNMQVITAEDVPELADAGGG